MAFLLAETRGPLLKLWRRSWNKFCDLYLLGKLPSIAEKRAYCLCLHRATNFSSSYACKSAMVRLSFVVHWYSSYGNPYSVMLKLNIAMLCGK